jgi:low affinity Fe/Cu permease
MATSMRRRRARTASSATLDDAAADAAPTKGRRGRRAGGPERKGPLLERLAHAATLASGTSMAFALAVAVVVVWVVTGPLFGFSDTWQLVINTGTTIVTFLMVFLIQRTQNKDSIAVQLKLNELVAAMEGASHRLINVEDLSEEDLGVLPPTTAGWRSSRRRTASSGRRTRSKKPRTARGQSAEILESTATYSTRARGLAYAFRGCVWPRWW